MAYLFLSTGTQEVDRRELVAAARTTAIVIGRAPDCDVSIHDILLSRKHCRLEPSADGRWTVSDLGSKNGTFVDERRVERHALGDGEVIQVGKTRITFHTGSFIPPPRSFNHPRPARPVDPQEALAGTVAGLAYIEPPPVVMSPFDLPRPQPRPHDPVAFARDDIYSMLEGIASSS